MTGDEYRAQAVAAFERRLGRAARRIAKRVGADDPTAVHYRVAESLERLTPAGSAQRRFLLGGTLGGAGLTLFIDQVLDVAGPAWSPWMLASVLSSVGFAMVSWGRNDLGA
ncbi:hypothetical protein [Aquipuribacter sp. SD81]|uniref:hypothetical protein n=1 Tax=Aquipuribacter sp. SD81 TaxID=3127703 RepID=UPI003018DC86